MLKPLMPREGLVAVVPHVGWGHPRAPVPVVTGTAASLLLTDPHKERHPAAVP